MAISVLQRTLNLDANGATGSVSKAYGSNNTAGSASIAILAATDSTEALFNTEFAAITDTQGNSYTRIFRQYTKTYQVGIYAYVAYNIKAGANTVSCSNDTNNPCALFIIEAAGLAAGNAFDRSGSTAYVAGTSNFDSGKAPATSFPNELLIGCGVSGLTAGQTWTLGSGYSNLQQQNNTSGLSSYTEEQLITTGTGNFNAIGTCSSAANGGLAVILTFSDTPGTVQYKRLNTGLRPHPFSPGLAR